jgi:hypothetical protein
MSYLIPIWELTMENRTERRQVYQEAMLQRAVNLGVCQNKYELTIRKLGLADLGLNNWCIKNGFRHTLPTWCVYGIYKLTALSVEPTAQHIRITKGNGRMPIFSADLAEMYSGLNIVKALYHDSLDELRVTEKLLGHPTTELEKFMENKEIRCEAYLSEPIIFDPADVMGIDVTPDNNDFLVIGGFVAERIGTTI